MFIVGFPEFMEIVEESGKRNIILEDTIYFLETKNRFEFYYTNTFWEFKTTVMKSEMSEFLDTESFETQEEVMKEFHNKFFSGRKLIKILEVNGNKRVIKNA